MIEPPQFRTVLRGADPEQVAEAIKELHTSLVVARRAAADRTIELSRMQEEHQAVQATLAAAQQRIAELEQQRPVQAVGYGDVGSRISSILSLAEEEAAQIRASAESEIAERREHAAHELAAELTAEQARLDEVRVRTAQLADELSETRALTDAENEGLLAGAQEEADRIRQQAQNDAERLSREAEHRRAEALAHRDRVHAHLREVEQMIAAVVEDGRVEDGRVEDGRVEDGHPGSGHPEDGHPEDGREARGDQAAGEPGEPMATEWADTTQVMSAVPPTSNGVLHDTVDLPAEASDELPRDPARSDSLADEPSGREGQHSQGQPEARTVPLR